MTMVRASGHFDRAEVIARAKIIFAANVAKDWGHAMRLAYAEAKIERERQVRDRGLHARAVKIELQNVGGPAHSNL